VRRLVLVLVVLVALLVVADRVTARLAERALAQQARESADLSSTPTVRVHGFPFLTQALRGKYGRIDLEATDLDRGGVRISRLTATVHGAGVPLTEALAGDVTSIPVAGLDATALVTFADLAHRSRLVGLSIVSEGDAVRVTGRVTVLGQTVRVSALSTVSLRTGRIAVTARSLKVLGQSTPGLVNALAGALDLLVPVGTLPYDLHLTGLGVTPDGLQLTARSGPTVLSAG
jgi:hypothetical protein